MRVFIAILLLGVTLFSCSEDDKLFAEREQYITQTDVTIADVATTVSSHLADYNTSTNLDQRLSWKNLTCRDEEIEKKIQCCLQGEGSD
jgi:hypothetical protein